MAEEYTTNDPGSVMRPTPSATNLYLPVTMEPHPGRNSDLKWRVILAAVVTVVTLVVCFGILTGDSSFIRKIVTVTLIVTVVLFVLRFVLFQEYRYRGTYSRIYRDKNIFPGDALWGILSVDKVEPHFVHYRNGTGLIVELENDVVVGKPEEDEYNSYEALSDAYQAAWETGLDIEHIDLMDFIGKDDRIELAKSNLARSCRNPELRSFMSSIYANLEEGMRQNVTTKDVYVFKDTNRETSQESMLQNVKNVLDIMCQGNYSGYRFLDQSEIGDLVSSLFNLKSFNPEQALIRNYDKSEVKGIKLLAIGYSDGTVDTIAKPYDIRQQELKEKERSRRAHEQFKRREEQKRKEAKKAARHKKNGAGTADKESGTGYFEF